MTPVANNYNRDLTVTPLAIFPAVLAPAMHLVDWAAHAANDNGRAQPDAA